MRPLIKQKPPAFSGEASVAIKIFVFCVRVKGFKPECVIFRVVQKSSVLNDKFYELFGGGHDVR